MAPEKEAWSRLREEGDPEASHREPASACHTSGFAEM